MQQFEFLPFFCPLAGSCHDLRCAGNLSCGGPEYGANGMPLEERDQRRGADALGHSVRAGADERYEWWLLLDPVQTEAEPDAGGSL